MAIIKQKKSEDYVMIYRVVSLEMTITWENCRIYKRRTSHHSRTENDTQYSIDLKHGMGTLKTNSKITREISTASNNSSQKFPEIDMFRSYKFSPPILP